MRDLRWSICVTATGQAINARRRLRIEEDMAGPVKGAKKKAKKPIRTIGLTLRQEAFIEAYLRLQNGRKAYKEVYDKAGVMKDNVADVGASKTLSIGKVREALNARKEEIQALNPVCTVEELAEGWSDEIRFDLAELVDEHGTFRNPKDLSQTARTVLKGLKIKESIVESEGGANTVLNRWIEYQLPDRQNARKELGKRIGFYPAEKVELGETLTSVLATLYEAALDKHVGVPKPPRGEKDAA